MIISNLNTAEALVRVFTGILFFSQGYDKLFRIGMKNVAHTFHTEAESHHVPGFLLWTIVVFTTLTELICGITLSLGFFRDLSLALLSIDLILAAFAFSFMTPMWDTRQVLKRLILVVLLLLCPVQWVLLSADHLIFKH
jgi:uncharacterized membrane protein YphA (DoxX/SURF4 family)